MALMEYKCPCCGGSIGFDSDIQKMKCPFCDTEFEMETLKSYDDALQNEGTDDLHWDVKPGSEWSENEADSLNTYVCHSCGGEIVTDGTTAATECPYCGNPVVMAEKLSGSLKPDYVIPFKLKKEDAKEALKKHFKGKLLLPKVFKDENHIDEIKGLYVPVWLFDANVDADIRYRGTKIRHWSDSEYNYTETSFYSVMRSGNVAYANVPVDGSEKMDDDLMESIEPFDMKEAVDFQTAYLAGYLADKYDVDAEHSIDRANQRMKQSTEDSFRRTVIGYSAVTVDHSSVRLSDGKAKYALYPVWLMHTTWRGQKYTFAMNGQTGKFVGNLPMNKGAFWGWFSGLFAGIGAAVYVLLILFGR